MLYATSVKENIAYGLDLWTDELVEKAARLANAHEFISDMKEKYNTNTGEKGLQLSGECMRAFTHLIVLSCVLIYLCLFAKAINQGTPLFSVHGHPLHFSPGVTHLFCFSFRVSLPSVSWPTSSPLPWGVPCDGLTGDGFGRFPECMSYLPPFSLLYFIFYG